MKMQVNCKPKAVLNIRETSNKVSRVVGTLEDEEIVEIETRRSGMAKLADGRGWANLKFLVKFEEPKPEPEEAVVE